MNDKNYTVYHLHSDRSLLDSCTNYKDYIDKASSLNMKAICFSEHGNIYNWIEKKMYCDEKGIKYLHGCEMYLTKTHEEKVRDNYHTILIAKNKEGFSELNTLIDISTATDHTYYKNRISYDEFLNISDNIIKISACLASPLSKEEDKEWFDKLAKKYDYYEIQYHNDRDGEQIKYNKKLYELSRQNNIPLIVGTDTHNLNEYKSECRKILKKRKKMSYDNEDDFDLTFKSYEQVLEMFDIQNSLPKEVILEALENTNIMADSCEDIVLDTSIKYPQLSKNDEELFTQRIYDKLKYKIENNIIAKDKVYLNRLNEEIAVFKKLNMCSFMLFMSEMVTWCLENNIPVGPCRGSVGGSLVAYILDIIDVNPITWKTVFSRFANEDRLEVGDIDLDFAPSQRTLVYQYIMDRFGMDKSAYILAIGTISDKGTIDDIGGALSEIWKEGNDKIQKVYIKMEESLKSAEKDKYPELAKWYTEEHYHRRLEEINKLENPYSLDNIARIKKEYENNPQETRDKYPDIFYYFDGLIGTAISQSVHPAGIVASPITLPDNYGTFWKDGQRIMQINMEEIHDGAGLVKYDILGLKNIEIIKDTCELANIPYPKSHNINWNDEEVWRHITDSPVGIFQFEGNYAYDLLKRFQPRKINDLSLVNASLRPSGASYRDKLIAKEFNKNPSELIDDLLKDNNGFLVFQEDTIAFLQQICGLSGSEADNIRRAIGRKQKDRLDKAMPTILEGYCSKSTQPRDIAESEAREFLQIIEDSSNYQFGYNHSTGYSMIGYLCGFLRYYYPLEFVCAYLNNANSDEDIKSGTELTNQLNIKINPPKFRYSKAKYHPDKATNSIYKGLSSIKYMNEKVSEELYGLRNNKYNNFLELLIDLENTSINSRQLEILIKLDFFLDEFGKSQKLLDIVEAYNNIYSKKQFKKDKLPLGLTEDIIREFATKETEKMFTQVDTTALMYSMIRDIPNKSIPIKDIFNSHLEFVGYIDYKDTSYNERVCSITEVKENKWGTVFVTLYKLCTGTSLTLKVDKNYFAQKPLTEYDLIQVGTIDEKFKRRKIDGKWVITEDKEYILTSYSMVVEEE